MFKGLGFFLFLFVISFQVEAFQLGEHEQVTRQAYAEFIQCFPRFTGQLDQATLIQSDADEDLNLIEKEVFFSHFYNPHKQLDLMWRGSSADRIGNLRPALLQCRLAADPFTNEGLWQLGHAIHHLQDMAVPAHVVPVNHSFWDGFETYGFAGDISSQWSCARIQRAANDELGSILNDTAEQTLAAIANWQVEILDESTHRTRMAQGTEFWIESNDSSFGDYGGLGNNFGTSKFDNDRGMQFVDEIAYKEFKQKQLQLAVRSTLRGLAWFLRP